jgi:ketosteroid isomerase-like protein
MTQSQPDAFPLFTAMLKRALGSLVDQDADGFLSLMAEDAVMEFPYAPSGQPREVAGRAALAPYVAHVASFITIDSIEERSVHRTTDPAVVVLEFTGQGRAVASGQPYRQDYISVIETGGGRITRYRDYWNPLALSQGA